MQAHAYRFPPARGQARSSPESSPLCTLAVCSGPRRGVGGGSDSLANLEEGSQLEAGKGKGAAGLRLAEHRQHPCTRTQSLTPPFPGRWILGVSTPNGLLSLPNRVHYLALRLKGRAEGGGKAEEEESIGSKIDWLKAPKLPFSYLQPHLVGRGRSSLFDW